MNRKPNPEPVPIGLPLDDDLDAAAEITWEDVERAKEAVRRDDPELARLLDAEELEKAAGEEG